MRRSSILWSAPFLSLAAACGASQDAPKAPLASTATPSAATTPAPVAPHDPTPAVPAGISSESVDASVSPCDDFFQYACGGWIKSHPIPEDKSIWRAFDNLQNDNNMALRTILEKDAASPAKDEPYAKALGDFYASCIDENVAEKDGLKAIEPQLKKIAAVADAKGFAATLAQLHLAGASPFFTVGSEQDFKDATQVIGQVDQAGLGMPDRDYYLKDDPKTVDLRAKYLAHVERMFTLLGDAPDVAKREAKAVFDLETELAKAQISRVEHRDPQNVYHRMTRAELAKAAPSIPWDAYFTALGAKGVSAVNVYEPGYLGAVDKKIGGATKATWENELRPYLRMQLVQAYAPTLTKKLVDEAFSFKKEVTGAEKNEPRWKRCSVAVDNGMGEALAVPFVKEKLGAEGKTITKEMVQAIETSMQKDLEGLTWMDEATRAKALAKVHKLFNKIGYPDTWRRYDGLKIDRTSYAANVMRAQEVEQRRQLAKIGKPVDRAEWGLTPPTVNAYYNPSLNEMVFPAGILQSPFFAPSAPTALNFGAIGYVMGHELTHGFDDEGRQFDGDGNMSDWWTKDAAAAFEKRAACVVDQFDSYVAVDDVHVNGKLTLGENIADLGGMKMSLAAAHAKGETSAEADRQFFFGAAQVWCGAARPEAARLRVRVDPHAPSKFRVNGPMSNMPEFAKAFACRAGDAMVRPEEKRCTVW
jgi:endothelin-converting enzyme/putative endopeptidase